MGWKLWVGLPVGLLVVGATVAGYVYYVRDAPQQPRYTTARVDKGSMSMTVNATGIVNAVVSVQVGSQISGTIQTLLADYNTTVKQGEVIAQIDPAPLETKVAQARANVAGAQAAVQVAQATVENNKAAVETAIANVASAKANIEKAKVALTDTRRLLERTKELVRRTLIAQSELDAAQTAHDTALSQLKLAEAQHEASVGQMKSSYAQGRLSEAQLVAAQAQVAQTKAALMAAELDLQHTTIRAPVNGMVIARNVDVGQTVAASLQAPVLFVIAQDLTQMQLDTNVSEADIGRIKVGQTVTFGVDAYANERFTGQVKQVRNAPITVQNVVTYNAVVQVANPALKLRPGMTANVAFLIDERQDVLKVPHAALRFQPEGGAPERSASPTGEAARGGGEGNPGRAQDMQQRLRQELQLDATQQTRLEDIFRQARPRFLAVREEESAERQRALRREIQAQIRTQVREILTPEQRQKYDTMLQARDEAQAQTRPGRVWVLGAHGMPEPRTLTLGIANDTHTEVVSGDLQAGQEILTGLMTGPKASSRSAPPGFGPRPF